MEKVYARCIIERYIGTDWYGRGDVFVMDPERVKRYADSFVILRSAPSAASLGAVADYEG